MRVQRGWRDKPAALRGCNSVVEQAMAYTAEEVVDLFEDDNNALDTLCMEGSDDELGFDDVEVVENPYYNHAAEFEDFEELEGKIIYTTIVINTKNKTN